MACFQFEPRGLSVQTLLRHLPEGVAWIAWRMPGKVARRLMNALADGYEAASQALCDLALELDPRTTDQMIGDWETAVSLPDACLPVATTLAERRFWVQWRLNKRRYTTAADWHYLASLFGLRIVITPGWKVQKPALFDAEYNARFDLFPKLGRFRVYINIMGQQYGGFDYGHESGISEGFNYPFSEDNDRYSDFKCLIERVKPANVVIVWDHPLEADGYNGFCYSESFSSDFSADFCREEGA